MKTPFTVTDGPLAGCSPANTLTVDPALVGVEPTAGDQRFILRWDRTRTTGGVAQGLYRFVKGEDGKVTAIHVPGVDDKALPTAEELAAARGAAAVATVRKLAEAHPEVREMLKEGV